MDVTLAEIWASTVTQVLARLDREEQLHEQRRKLTRERDRLADFANLVSHDLRNPLNVAMGGVDLVRDEYASEQLNAVADALDRMDQLIDDLLTLARQGEAVGSRDAVQLSSLVETGWATVETARSELVITTDLTVLADEGRLQQVFENLFRNAIEHGGADVTITVGDLSDERGFFVEDDGAGIPDAAREDVFATGYSTATEGTGFGLSIVRDIVEAHGWEIRATDGREGGARFEITNVDTV
jgi:signal transduction histidine kinase